MEKETDVINRATDVLMGFIHEHWEEMRHIENQRATMANLILTISSALIGLIATIKISQDTLALSLALAFLGLYGWIATAKLYERHQFDQNRLDKWYMKVDQLNPKAEYIALRAQADKAHYKLFPPKYRWVGLTTKMHLHTIWLALYVVIFIVGTGLSIFTWMVYF